MRKKPRKPNKQRIFRQAIYHLEKYTSSIENLRSVLERRLIKASRYHEFDMTEAKEWIDEALKLCQEYGYLNDQTYANSRADRLSRSGKSERAIRQNLQMKKIDSDLIDKIINKMKEEIDNPEDLERARAAKFAKKKRLGPYRPKDRDINRQKDLTNLGRNGFMFSIAKDIIDAENIDELEEWIEKLDYEF